MLFGSRSVVRPSRKNRMKTPRNTWIVNRCRLHEPISHLHFPCTSNFESVHFDFYHSINLKKQGEVTQSRQLTLRCFLRELQKSTWRFTFSSTNCRNVIHWVACCSRTSDYAKISFWRYSFILNFH